MKVINKTIPKYVDIFSYVFVAILIVVSNDTLIFGTNNVHFLQSIPRYGAIVLCLLLLLMPRLRKVTTRDILVLLCLFIPYILSSLLRESSLTLFGIFFLCILVGYLVATRLSFKKFAICFETIIFFLCIFAIVGELFAYLTPGLLTLCPKVHNVSGCSFSKLLFCNIEVGSENGVLIRNGGIFREPGVFQIYINFALMINLFYLKRNSLLKFAIYSLALLFTFSTPGYVCYLFILIVYVFGFKKITNNTPNSSLMSKIVLLCLIIVSIVLFNSKELSSLVFGKIGDFQNGSFLSRLNSIVADFYMVKSSPFIGVGMGKVDDLTVYYADKVLHIYADCNSNGVFYQFAAYGLVFGLVYFIGLASLTRNFELNKLMTIILALIFLLLFFGERLESWFPYIFMFYGIESFSNKKRETNYERTLCECL